MKANFHNTKHVLMKNQIIIVVLMLFFVKGIAQEQPGNREMAYRYIYEYQYAKAVPLLLKVVDVKKPKAKDIELLAKSYYQINAYTQACNWYARLLEFDNVDPEVLIEYAKSLKQISEYSKAKSILEEYAQKTGNNQKVAKEIEGCTLALKWQANPESYMLRNEKVINTEKSEFSPFPLENQLYYVGEKLETKRRYGWTGNSFLKIYNAKVDDVNQLSSPELKELFNEKKFHVGPITSNKAGNIFYVTQTYTGRKGNKGKEGDRKYLSNKLEVYIYSKDNSGNWKATPFPYNNVKEYSVGHAVLSSDEKVLYFVSDMSGSIGGTDIWYSELDAQNNWTAPKNAGYVINSLGNEMFPTVDSNGSLYFSSDGFVSMGGLDVFKTEGSKASWSTPKNLQYPVNSGGDDFGFIVSEIEDETMSGYLSSNRLGGKGGDDIYSFNYKKTKRFIALEGITYEGKTTEKLLSEVAVSLFSGKERQLIAKKESTAKGEFVFEIEPNTSYKILGQKKGFYSDSLVVDTKTIKAGDTLKVALHLESLLEINKRIVLEGIHYDFDKHDIRKDAAVILNELVAIMHAYSTLKIELSSHTDSRGRDAYNMKLSQRRAQSVVDYLVNNGISRDRLQAKGYGESQLLNKCFNGVPCSKESHQENRRTEVKVLSF